MPTESASAAAARDPSPPLRGASLRPLRSLRMTTRWLAYCQRRFDRERPSLGAKITDVPRVSGRKGPCSGPLATFGGRLPSSCVPGRGPGLRANGGVGDFCTEGPRLHVKPPSTCTRPGCHPERRRREPPESKDPVRRQPRRLRLAPRGILRPRFAGPPCARSACPGPRRSAGLSNAPLAQDDNAPACVMSMLV